MNRCIAVIVGWPLLLLPALASAAAWQIDSAHSNFGFKIRHLMVSNVKGEFTKSSGTVLMDDQDITKMKIEIMIDAASVYTGNAKRDDHLKTADFFDTAKYPSITFVSKGITKGDKDRLKVTGDLTLRGVTREVTVDVEGPTPEIKDPSGNMRRGATATATINRRDYGVNWNRVLDAGGVVVGDEVFIAVEIELIKK